MKISESDVNEALETLISKGIVEISHFDNGQAIYKLTEIGKLYAKHENTDPKKRN